MGASYAYNTLGQRVSKTVNRKTRLFAYDLDGRLIGEYDESGKPIREYIYLNDRPIAMLRPKGQRIEVLFIHTDHLGTPKLLTNDKGQVRWEAQARPFGGTEAKGKGVELPLRLPGQYEDEESGLHYNYFRDYDPDTGRYLIKDPIGLDGGLNTYSYALDNPLRFIDPFGLDAFSCLNMAMNGEQSFMDCYIDNEIIKPMEDKFDAFAEAADCGLKCTAVCGAKFAAGAATAKAAKRGAEDLTKKFAKGTVKKFLKRGIPVAGWIETGISGGLAITCTVNCWCK